MEKFVADLEHATKKRGDEGPDILGGVGVVVRARGEGGGEKTTTQTYFSGVASLSPTAGPLTPSTPLTLASCTKLITTLTALRLVERGTLSLTSPDLIKQHLPELCSQPVFKKQNPDHDSTSSLAKPGDDQQAIPSPSLSVPEYETREKDITLQHLLTHTSGSGYDMISPPLLAWRKARGEEPQALSGILPDAISYPLLFQPGEGWSYGTGFDWVGLLIERVSGEKLGDVMKREVFDVVGCDAVIGFDRENVETSAGERVAQVVVRVDQHQYQHAGGEEEGQRGRGGRLNPYPVNDLKGHRGGGGLFSTASNFAKVLADIISPSPKLLSKQTLDLLFSPLFAPGSSEHAALLANSRVFLSMAGPLTAGSLSKETPADALNHSLAGLVITRDTPGLGKTGGTVTWGGAFNCVWFANREQGVAGFFGSAMFPPGDGKCSEVVGEFVSGVWMGWDVRGEGEGRY